MISRGLASLLLFFCLGGCDGARETSGGTDEPAPDKEQQRMDGDFDVRSGCIAIGDPTMGLPHYPLNLPAGRYRLQPGALREVAGTKSAPISLDGPFLFVVDASLEAEFLSWYHRTFDECGYIVPRVVERLPEVEAKLGVRIGFYWEEELVGAAKEGTYQLDPANVIRVALPHQ
jgi:hypothetical protein